VTATTSRLRRLAVVGLTLVAATLGLAGLGRFGLWRDEVLSLQIVSADWAQMWSLLRAMPEQHPVYYFILRLWMRLGDSELVLRALSVVFAAASIPFMWHFAKMLCSRVEAALVATVLLAMSPFYLYYAQEARMYTLLGFLAIVASLALARWLEREDGRWLVWYGVSSSVGVYTHFFFSILMISHLAGVMWWRDYRGAKVFRLLAVQALVAVAYAPWLFVILTGQHNEQMWKGWSHVLLSLPYTFMRFALGYAEVLANGDWQANIIEVVSADLGVVVPGAVVFGYLVLAGTRRMLQSGWRGRLILASTFAPFLITLVLSPVRILVGERYFIVCLPFVLVIVGEQLMALRESEKLRFAVIATLLALVTAIPLWHFYRRSEFGKEQWREAAAFVSRRAQKGDVIYVLPDWLTPAFRYYWRGANGCCEVEGAQDHGELARLLGDESRVWLVASWPADSSAIHRVIRKNFAPTDQARFVKNNVIGVTLWVRQGASMPTSDD